VARLIPFDVSPLQRTLVKPFHRPGWVYEEKVDGWRIVAYKAGATYALSVGRASSTLPAFLISRRQSRRFQGRRSLDGEVAVFNDQVGRGSITLTILGWTGELWGPQRKAVASTRAYGAMKPRRAVTFGSGVGPSRSTGSRRSRPGAGSPRASSRSSA
jgi:hypothetical protein